MTFRTTALLAMLCGRSVADLAGQEPLAVSVRDSVTARPVAEAVGRLRNANVVAAADRLGRLRFGPFARPDTLIVIALGFRPETLLIADHVQALAVGLSARPLTLAELTVGGDADAGLAPAATGTWRLPREAIRAVPHAVEADPLRALAILPSVVFSSPLSARPIIRGYDAAEQVIRIDGFEILNPYHIGRIFAAFPVDFTQSVDVAVIPHRATDGNAVGGVIDLVGMAAGVPGWPNAGLDGTLTSLTGWYGWRGPLQGFAGARLASIKFLSSLASRAAGEEGGVPYSFRDTYARQRVPLPGARRIDLTIYSARDELGAVRLGADAAGALWTNLLLGQRTRVLDRTTWSADVTASWNRFTLDVQDIAARFSNVDVRNRFERWHAGAEVQGVIGAAEWHVGASVGRRSVVNDVVAAGDDLPDRSQSPRLREVSAYASIRAPLGRAILVAGGRVDASPSATVWQPRLRLSAVVGRGAVAALSYARAARLYQVVTDPQPEPTFAFYDFWFNAGDSTVPVPQVDHLAGELDVVRGQWSAHAAAYVSRGTGLGELRPLADQRDTSDFRFGDSRTAGLEFRLARRPATPRGLSAVLSYALSWSERRWEDGAWRPWTLDHRQRVRLQAELPVSSRTRLFALGEGRSAQPVLHVEEVFYRDLPRLPGDTAAPRLRRLPDYSYAPEGSVRGSGVFFVDVGCRVSLGGPGRSEITLGLAVTNLIFGPVAPLEPALPDLDLGTGAANAAGVPYERRYTLPPVPSITVRWEF